MPKSTDIEDALVTQLSNDADIDTEFTGKISKGLGRNFNYNTDGQGIRVYLIGSESDFTNAVSQSELTWYGFLVTVLFSDDNETSVETRKAKYDDWIRSAIRSDLTIGGNALDLEFGRTEYREDPKHEALHYVLIQLSIRAYEA